MTPAEAARVFRSFTKEKDRVIVNAIRRWQNAVRTEAINRFRSRGMGRAVFGRQVVRGTKGVRAIIKRERVRKEGDSFRADMTMKGLAALQETGGRTAAHSIRSHQPSNLLSRRGTFVASTKNKPVQHPGSNVARRPFLVPAAVALEPRLGVELDQGLTKLAAQLGLGGGA